MLRSSLRAAAKALKGSLERGTLPQDSRVWANAARRIGRAGRTLVQEQAGKALQAARAGKREGWMELAEEGRQKLADAARIARREAEQLEAYDIFERAEGTTVAHRAQAVVMLKYLELEAEKLVCQLPRYRRDELRELAQKVRDAALAQSELTRDDANCGQCTRQLAPELRGGDCCSGMVFMAWDEIDALLRVLLGEYAPVFRSWHGDFTRCGFVVGERCALSPGTRPVVCQAYYCGSYRTALDESGRWGPLGDLLKQLDAARAQLGFRVKLSRRFGLGEVAHSVTDHPVDFIWERMRARGARYAASSADSTQGATNPRLKIMH